MFNDAQRKIEDVCQAFDVRKGFSPFDTPKIGVHHQAFVAGVPNGIESSFSCNDGSGAKEDWVEDE